MEMTTQTEADDGTDEKNTVQWKRDLRDRLLTEADVEYDSEAEAFLEVALEKVAEKLATNHMQADSGMPGLSGGPKPANYKAVSDLLSDNVYDVDLRKNGLAMPKVTVWLNDSPPMWGNTADRVEFKFSKNREHYNGKQAAAIIDVRPF